MSRPAGQAARKQGPKLLRLVYERNPRPVNCTTLGSTKSFLEDDSHPLYIKTERRLAAFDPTTLHWRVHCPIDASKKAVIRRWAARRVQTAFRKELRDAGLQHDGTLFDTRSPHGNSFDALRGAALLILPKDGRSLTASEGEVEESCAGILRDLIALQGKHDKRSPLPPPGRHSRVAYGGQSVKHNKSQGQSPTPTRLKSGHHLEPTTDLSGHERKSVKKVVR